ncbi:carbohydrate ABC transporter permease [Paenibacillus sp. HB172176]|uniref:carbohydrate ABC transporter permease n=1 Tax=Paenibacillus sp. HB172176 TaxID=2493690 RepID=UPI0014393C43|nr:carbohydrate ABC transporter permease [Paenibacillus sp. HB172176]
MKIGSIRRDNSLSPVNGFLLNIGFVVLSLLCLLPVVLVVIVSFTHSESIVAKGYSFLPDRLSLIAYESLFKDYGTILGGYAVSIGITIAGTLLSVVMMALYAYPISRSDYTFRGGFTFFLFFTMLFNGGLVSRYLVYTKVLGLKDSYIALIIPLLIIPFNVIIMRTFFQTTIHPAVVESAKIDGAGELRIFATIVLPLSLPVLATMALFSTINYWNDWFNALLYITSEDKFPLQYLMMRVLNDVQYLRNNIELAAQNPELLANLPNESLQMAMAVVGMGPMLIIYPFFQKYFVKGLTVGAVKG